MLIICVFFDQVDQGGDLGKGGGVCFSAKFMFVCSVCFALGGMLQPISSG
jgi:hypothetical protein